MLRLGARGLVAFQVLFHNDMLRIECYHQLFVGRCNDDTNFRGRSRQLDFFAVNFFIEFFVYFYTHEAELVTYRFTAYGLVFSHTAGKYDNIDAIESCGIRSDVFDDAVFIHREGEFGFLIALCNCIFDFPHIR